MGSYVDRTFRGLPPVTVLIIAFTDLDKADIRGRFDLPPLDLPQFDLPTS